MFYLNSERVLRGVHTVELKTGLMFILLALSVRQGSLVSAFNILPGGNTCQHYKFTCHVKKATSFPFMQQTFCSQQIAVEERWARN